MTTIAISHIVL